MTTTALELGLSGASLLGAYSNYRNTYASRRYYD